MKIGLQKEIVEYLKSFIVLASIIESIKSVIEKDIQRKTLKT
tara:strand:- start:153 stop:278 length:126 start_codon:yes stop_codon:yes gene_type:complete